MRQTAQQCDGDCMPREVVAIIVYWMHHADMVNEMHLWREMQRVDCELMAISSTRDVLIKQEMAVESFRHAWNECCCDDPTAVDRVECYADEHVLLHAERQHMDVLAILLQRQGHALGQRYQHIFFRTHRASFAGAHLTEPCLAQQSDLFIYLLYNSIHWRHDKEEAGWWRALQISPPGKAQLYEGEPVTRLLGDAERRRYLQQKLGAVPTNMLILQRVLGSDPAVHPPTYSFDDAHEWWTTGSETLYVMHRRSYASGERGRPYYAIDRNDQKFEKRADLMRWLVDHGHAQPGTYCTRCLAWGSAQNPVDFYCRASCRGGRK